MQSHLDEVRQLARDLRAQEPRPVSEKLGGYKMGARTLDKCRASLVGWEGEFQFGCPMDQGFFAEAGIDEDEFRDFVATGAPDGGVDKWIRLHAHSRK